MEIKWETLVLANIWQHTDVDFYMIQCAIFPLCYISFQLIRQHSLISNYAHVKDDMPYQISLTNTNYTFLRLLSSSLDLFLMVCQFHKGILSLFPQIDIVSLNVSNLSLYTDFSFWIFYHVNLSTILKTN